MKYNLGNFILIEEKIKFVLDLYKAGKHSDAQPIIEDILKTNNNNHYIWILCGNNYFKLKEIEKAEQCYMKALQSTDDSNVYELLADLFKNTDAIKEKKYRSMAKVKRQFECCVNCKNYSLLDNEKLLKPFCKLNNTHIDNPYKFLCNKYEPSGGRSYSF